MGIAVDDTHSLLSLDVISLFSNIPIDIALMSVKKRWEFIEKNTNVPRDKFLMAISLVLSSIYFSFNGQIYKQSFGIPMGSPLSPVIADITMQDFDDRALNMLGIHIPIYFRYVDDIVMAAPSTMVEHIKKTFN